MISTKDGCGMWNAFSTAFEITSSGKDQILDNNSRSLIPSSAGMRRQIHHLIYMRQTTNFPNFKCARPGALNKARKWQWRMPSIPWTCFFKEKINRELGKNPLMTDRQASLLERSLFVSYIKNGGFSVPCLQKLE